MFVRSLASVWTLCLLAACTCQGQAGTDPAPQPVAPAKVEAEPSQPAVPELSEEDKRLLAADPKTLTPEERRKRAFALRRKIMQNPDSPAARTLEDLRKAHEAGQLDPSASGVKFEARTADGKPPTGTMGPAGARPAEPSPTGAP